jgi:hypothetical protein
MYESASQDGLRLLRAAKDIFVEQQGADEGSFRAGTTLDLAAAGELVGMPVGFPSHNAAVEWLESERAIEADPMYRRVTERAIEPHPMYRRPTTTIHRVTATGVELTRQDQGL